MERFETKGKIIKETLPSEIISIIGSILGGIILVFLILPFESFAILIIIIPALLSLRGNLSGPYIARTSRDLIIGEFNKRSILENMLATYALALVNAFLIGFFSILMNIFLFGELTLPILILIFMPVLSLTFTLSLSVPCSTGLNIIAFKFGVDPNNVVGPIMSCIDDFLTVLCFFLTILLLGVP
ncbi:MAG: magnesium transporter [Promethearchaeota archaeon]